jgi:hypothetical protein
MKRGHGGRLGPACAGASGPVGNDRAHYGGRHRGAGDPTCCYGAARIASRVKGELDGSLTRARLDPTPFSNLHN